MSKFHTPAIPDCTMEYRYSSTADASAKYITTCGKKKLRRKAKKHAAECQGRVAVLTRRTFRDIDL
jgi:hypothetical protein